MTRRAFALTMGSIPLALARSWDEPAFPNWSTEFTDKILTDSPWARPITISFQFVPEERSPEKDNVISSLHQIELPGGIGLPRVGGGIPGIGYPGGRGPGAGRSPYPGPGRTGSERPVPARAEVFLTTRWSSALPVRQAIALSEYGREGLENPKAVELLTTNPSEYIVEISGFPTTVVPNVKQFEAELKKSARISLQGRRAITPNSVTVPPHGMHLVATLRFPRYDDLGAGDRDLHLLAEARGMRIEQRFKLKSMVYRDRLEL